jgi:hypothetical protein
MSALVLALVASQPALLVYWFSTLVSSCSPPRATRDVRHGSPLACQPNHRWRDRRRWLQSFGSSAHGSAVLVHGLGFPELAMGEAAPRGREGLVVIRGARPAIK